MTKKHKHRSKVRERLSLKAPFTRKRLEKFLAKVPAKARFRIVTVNFSSLTPTASVAYLEASWKPKKATKTSVK